MTGIGAIFELYESFNQISREEKTKQKEQAFSDKVDAQNNAKAVKGYRLEEESEWHKIIRDGDWDTLLVMLQHYDFKKYKPKDKVDRSKKKQRLKLVRAAFAVKDKLQSMNENRRKNQELARKAKKEEEEEGKKLDETMDVSQRSKKDGDINHDSMKNKQDCGGNQQGERQQQQQEEDNNSVILDEDSICTQDLIGRSIGISDSVSTKDVDSQTTPSRVEDPKQEKAGDDDEHDTEDEEEILSPLLGCDVLGQTPMHVACLRYGAPDNIALRLLFCEKRAAAVADDNGQLPLHIAACNQRNNNVLDRLMRAHIPGIQQVDGFGQTALCYILQRILEHIEKEDKEYRDKGARVSWDLPQSEQEIEWQARQEVVWERLRFFLLAYSTRRKVLVQEEKHVLFDVLEHAAPPSVVELALYASQGIIKTEPSIASSALELFMRREYPIKNLNHLLHHFPVSNFETMEATRRLLAKHYHMGCQPPAHDKTKMAYRSQMEKSALDPSFVPNIRCLEWWDRIKCLLKLCGYGNEGSTKKKFDNKKHMLHAAVSNCDTPPSLVQLLMAMAPKSITIPCPGTDMTLVHLICGKWRYNLFPQSERIGVEHDMDEPPMEQIFRLALAADKKPLRKRYGGRLPFHLAVASFKSLEFLQIMTTMDPKLVTMRDQITNLFPFQMAAMSNINKKNSAMWASKKHSRVEWNTMGASARDEEIQAISNQQELDQLSMIYFLLRLFPSAVSTAFVLRNPALYKDENGVGMVSAHYLNWCYVREADEAEYEDDSPKADWKVHTERMELIKTAIASQSIPEGLEDWYGKLKFWIWYCYPKDFGVKMPQRNSYLLHAALANPDTPPLVIELLLAVNPVSASLPIFGVFVYPLHIAAKAPLYKPQPYEIPYEKNLLKLLVQAFPEATMIRSEIKLVAKRRRKNRKLSEGEKALDGMPLNIAEKSGKSWEDIKPMVEDVQRIEDPDDLEDSSDDNETDKGRKGNKEEQPKSGLFRPFRKLKSSGSDADDGGAAPVFFNSFRKPNSSKNVVEKPSSGPKVAFRRASFAFGLKSS